MTDSSEEKMNWFEDMFYNDIESWFSADIACCDSCYDEFVSTWPAVYQRDVEFQKSSIDLDCFYEGSRLADIYSKDEFWQGMKNIRCDRCGNLLTANIWPYNLPFDPPDNFEDTLSEIAAIAKATPFLVLSHPYAKQAQDYIKTLFSKSQSVSFDSPLYRARVISKENFTNTDFGPPPKRETKEGRYNHAGNPVLYICSAKKTCFYELDKPKKAMMTAEISVNAKLKVLDLLEQFDSDESLLQSMVWSSLLSSSKRGQGWYNPSFVFTRFLADCAKQAGFDAIKYPSVRIDSGFNVAILNSDVIKNDIIIGQIEPYN